MIHPLGMTGEIKVTWVKLTWNIARCVHHRFALGSLFNAIIRITNTFGSRDCALMRVLAFHQCGPGLIPGPGIICGLSLLLVLILAPRVFCGFSGFPPSTKINAFKF